MTADPATVAAARQLLEQLGITAADLHTTPSTIPGAAPVPALAEYVARVRAAAGPGARRTYGTYWDRMAALWGDRPMTSFAATDIEYLKHETASTAQSRRNSRHGRAAGEHAIAAARALFNRAIADGIIAPGD